MNIKPLQWVESAFSANVSKLNRANHLLDMMYYWTDPKNKPSPEVIQRFRAQIEEHLKTREANSLVIDEKTINDIAEANKRYGA